MSMGNFSDDELIEMMYPIMQDHENAKPFPYYDTRWNITVGVGNNVNNEKNFYGTNGEIITDSIKDLKNDFLGIAKGLSSSDINQCSNMLPQKTRKQML